MQFLWQFFAGFVLKDRRLPWRFITPCMLLCIGLHLSTICLGQGRSFVEPFAPVSQQLTVYGLSLVLSCEACTPGTFIDTEVKRQSDGAIVASARVYPRYGLSRGIYNIFFIEKSAREYVDGQDGSKVISPKERYNLHLKSSSEITYEPGSLKWQAQPYSGFFAGTNLSGIEKQTNPLYPLALGLLLEGLAILAIASLVFRADLLAPVAKQSVSLMLIGGLLALIVYYATLCLDHPGGDSREFQYLQLGFHDLHQPGSPILAVVASLFGAYFPIGTFMMKAHFFASLSASLGIAVLCAALFMATGSAISAFIPAMVLATSKCYWNYAVIAQSYSFSALFQALMLLSVFNAARKKTTTNFVVAVVLAIAMLTTHPTNGYWGFFWVLFMVPVFLSTPSKMRVVAWSVSSVSIALCCIYLPYLLFDDAPSYFLKVITYLDEHMKALPSRHHARYIQFSVDAWHTYIQYILGNRDHQSWTSGIVSIVTSSQVFSLIQEKGAVFVKVLFYGFGRWPTVVGFVSLFAMLLSRRFRWLGLGLLLSLTLNLMFCLAEMLYFHVGYYEIFFVHTFPSYFILTISIAFGFKMALYTVDLSVNQHLSRGNS